MHSQFELAQSKQEQEPPILKTTTQELEDLGLFFRPELREEQYQERISHDEAWKELLKVMPGLIIPLSGNWDSNSFLVHSMWMEMGARTTFNLVNLFAAPKIWKSSQTQIEVAQTRRKALSIATLVQVNVSYLQYLKSLESYRTANELNKIDQNIFKVITDTTVNDAGSELERIHAATAALASQLEKEQSFAEIHSALGNIYASIGLNPVEGDIEHITVRTLAVQLEKNLTPWYKGEFPKLPNAPVSPKVDSKAAVDAAKTVAVKPEPEKPNNPPAATVSSSASKTPVLKPAQ